MTPTRYPDPQETTVPTQVRARYANGKLEPLEPLDLQEGCGVAIRL